jgi:hypothetical protein
MTFFQRYLKLKCLRIISRFESFLNKFRREHHNEAYLMLVKELKIALK